MPPMKSFADLKRFFAKPGATITQTRHDNMHPQAPSKLIGQRRKIDKLQSNAVRFEGGSWWHFPSAKSVRFTDDGYEVCLRNDGTFAQVMAYRCELQPELAAN